MKPAVISMLAALLVACQTSAYEGNENSPFYPVPAGSTLTLTRGLTIPAEQVAVFLQGGEVVASGGINQYYPHCKFELQRRLDKAQTVQADSFEITKVVQEIGHSVALDGLQLAGVSIGIGINIGSRGDGASLQTWSTRMTLRSARQPEVFRLSCGQTALPHEGQHVSINEMRKALGGIFTLELAKKNR
jgi:hypothetical protein